MLQKREPTHPGIILREDVLKPLGITVTEASRRLKVNRKTLSLLLNCKSSLSPEMAIRIGKATGTTPESWLYMQAKYNLWQAQQRQLTEVESLNDKVVV